MTAAIVPFLRRQGAFILIGVGFTIATALWAQGPGYETWYSPAFMPGAVAFMLAGGVHSGLPIWFGTAIWSVGTGLTWGVGAKVAWVLIQHGRRYLPGYRSGTPDA